MMFTKTSLFFLFLMLCSFEISFGQVVPQKVDSAKMYRNIEKYSKRSKFTKLMHKLIFEPVSKQKIKQNTFQKSIKKKYNNFEGKIIRKIDITTLDPFGYSEVDTTIKPTKYVHKLGNTLHNKTRKFAIGNLLLIKKNKPLDSLLVKESERLIRSQRFIRSVNIQTKLVSENSDSVDVFIRVLDGWSLVPDFTTSTSTSTFRLKDKNFFGTGHEFVNTYRKSLTTSKDAYSTSYTVPNIMNTFVKTTLSYQIDINDNYGKFINIERPFFSVYTRWAGGVYFGQQFRKEISLEPNLISQTQNFKYNIKDYWAGYSHQVFKGNTEANRAINLITSVRFLDTKYIERPEFLYDSLRVYSNEKFFLTSIGLSSRKFTQDKDLFNFNVTEDVASGIIYNLTGGYQKKNNLGRYYFGARFAIGRYFKFGYFSTNAEYGTFFTRSKTTQSAFVLSSVYFTNLLETTKWKFRQFIKPELVIGNNRLATNADKLTLNDNNGIQGFNSSSLFGTKKLLVTFQTQGYSPWRVIGFRLNPYLSYTMGMIGENFDQFKNSQIYSQIGAGIIVSNDYLVFSSFQFSFSFYPTIPGYGDSILKTNSFKTYDFGLQSFEISKPNTVPYQ